MSADVADVRAWVARVSEELPEGWGAVFVLARVDPKGGTEVLAGGVRFNRRMSIDLLRSLLEQFEDGAGAPL